MRLKGPVRPLRSTGNPVNVAWTSRRSCAAVPTAAYEAGFAISCEAARARLRMSVSLDCLNDRYDVGKSSQNCISTGEPDRRMSTKTDLEKGLINRVVSALQEDRFLLHAQTIAPLASHPSTLFQEIFVRYRDEDENLMPPGSFLYILEEHKLLAYLDRWVVNRLARWSRDMLKADPDWKVPRCNVNLATDTIVDEKFGEYVRQHILRSPLSQGAIGFEVDWESAVAYQEALRRLITELRPLGCFFTLADFDGSDQSFQMLKSFAPHFVKISSATLDRTRLSEINRRCRLLECKTIVEYVESVDLLDELRRANTDFAQGFAISQVEPL